VPGRRRALVEYVIEHSLVLALGSAIALVWANTPDAERYYRLAARLAFLVNDVGMVFFFALAAKEIVEAPPDARDALSRFERAFKYPVQVVLFLFGFTNAGVRLGAVGAGTWAVMVAIIVGKPIGICLSVALSMAVGLRLPAALRWTDVVVVGIAGGIGFTVALFFAIAAFPPGPILEQLKLGALGSLASALLAFAAAAILRTGRFRA